MPKDIKTKNYYQTRYRRVDVYRSEAWCDECIEYDDEGNRLLKYLKHKDGDPKGYHKCSAGHEFYLGENYPLITYVEV